MRIFRNFSPSAMAPILTFFVVALVCNIGFLVGGAEAAPLGLKTYVPASRHYDCLSDRLMQDSSCYPSPDSSRLGRWNLWRRSNDEVTLHRRPNEVQAPPQSEARPSGNTETLNGLHATPESTKTWKKAVLMRLGSLLRSGKQQGTGVKEILTNLWNWVVKTAKKVLLAPGREKWREAEIERLDTRAKELEAKIAAARQGATDGGNVHGGELVLTPMVIDLPEPDVTVDDAGSILEPYKQGLEHAMRPKTAQDLGDHQSMPQAHARKAGTNSDSALPGTPNSPQRQSRASAGLESAKAIFRHYQDGRMQVGVHRLATARKVPGKLDNMPPTRLPSRVPKVPTPEAPAARMGDKAGSTDPGTTVKPTRRPKSSAAPIPHPTREDEDDSLDGPGVVTELIVQVTSDAESPDQREREVTTEYPTEPLETDATPTAPALTPTFGTVEEVHVSENALAADDGLPVKSFTQEELLEYSGMDKAIDLNAALAHGGDLIVTPQDLIESRSKLIDRVQKNEQRIKLREEAIGKKAIEVPVAGLEVGPADVNENTPETDDGLPIENFTQEELWEYSGMGKAIDLNAALAHEGDLIVTPQDLIESRRKLIDRVQKNELRIKLRKAAEVGVLEAEPTVTHDAAVPMPVAPPATVFEAVAPCLTATSTLVEPPSVLARLAGWVGLGNIALMPSNKSIGRHIVMNTLGDESLDRGGDDVIVRRAEGTVRRPSRQEDSRRWEDTRCRAPINHSGLMLPSSTRPPQYTGFSIPAIFPWLIGTKPRDDVNHFPDTPEDHLDRGLTNEWAEEVSIKELRESQGSPWMALENPWAKGSSDDGSERSKNHLGLTDYFMRDTDESLGWGDSTMESLESILARAD
ncbi:hypothetical protein BGX38DRAFT_1162072 [Terfezia claveryi]|nr:hypothetical protein BGX38DRAFT_1162072 [Terfezia claveryi]